MRFRDRVNEPWRTSLRFGQLLFQLNDRFFNLVYDESDHLKGELLLAKPLKKLGNCFSAKYFSLRQILGQLLANKKAISFQEFKTNFDVRYSRWSSSVEGGIALSKAR